MDITSLEHLRTIQKSLDDVRADLVLQMRRDGYTWAQIGKALGITAEAARIRYTVRAGVEDPGLKR